MQRLSSWIVVDEYCATRVLEGTDPSKVENRRAFIEKTPRVLDGGDPNDSKNWRQGPKGCAPEYGAYKPSRAWCDKELKKMGYILT